MKFDGSFESKGERISYLITDKYDEGVRSSHGIEKMSRYINFYNTNDESIGSKNIYGTIDEMQNISPVDAQRWYEEFRNSTQI